MLRSLLVLGALLACSGAFAKQKLSTKIRPCESFYDYVCNEDENASEDLFVTQIKQTLYDEILEKFLSLTDTHTDIAVDEFLNATLTIYIRDHYLAKGEKLGAMVAEESFNAVVTIYEDYRFKTISIDYPRRETNKKTVCKFSDCPPYYKGLATGYLRVVDLMGLMPKEETTLEIFADDSLDIPALSEATEIEPWKRVAMTNLIADTTGQFHSHVNMLIGVFFLDRFPKSMYDNLEVMYENIKTELYLSIQETANLSPEAKRNLLHTLNVTEKHFGLPEIFRNMDLLQDYFQVVNQTITEGIAKRGYQQMKPEQRIRAIAQMLQLAAKRFRAQHPTIVDDYSWTKIHTKHPEHHSVFQFDSSVWFHSVSVFFYPSLIQVMDVNMPIGFKYGFIGTVITDGLITLLEQVYEKNHGNKKLINYASGEKCQFFTDADIARIVFKVLQKARKQLDGYHLTRAKRFSETTFNDREWFFIGLTSRFCVAKSRNDNAHYKPNPWFDHLSEAQKQEDHKKRMNQVASEMSQFADLFQCPKEFTKEATCRLGLDKKVPTTKNPKQNKDESGKPDDDLELQPSK